MNGFMKRAVYCALLALSLTLLCAAAHAEISTNLRQQSEKGKSSRRIERVWFEDENGNPAFADDLGYASIHYTYNRKPRCIREEYLDLNGELCNMVEGYAYITQRWDGNGRLLERAYFDKDDQPVLGPEGYHHQVTVYDHKHVASMTHYGTDGQYLVSDTLPAVTRYTYKDGYCVLQCTYDAQLEPMNNANGYARVERTFKKGKMSSEYFYDRDDRLVYNEARGYAGYLQTYDAGKLRKTEYFGADGHYIMYKGAYAYTENKFDKKSGSLPAMTMFYDTEGNLCTQRSGYAMVAFTYVSGDRPKSIAYYNEVGERTYISAGYSKVVRLYTTGGNVWKEAYYDTEDHLMVLPSKGYAMVERQYNSKGKIKSEKYYDENGDRMLTAQGYANLNYTYQNGKLVEEFYTDLKGKRQTLASGYSAICYEYDGDNVSARVTLNDRREPVDSVAGYARCEMTYLFNVVGDIRYYHADGTAAAGPEGVFQVSYRYDENGAVTERRCWTEDGQPALSSDGWHYERTDYDENGRKVYTAWYDASNAPVLTTQGCAAEALVYNQTGELISCITLGVNAEPINSIAGYAAVEYTYTETGRKASVAYYAADGNLTPGEKGYAGAAYTYTEDGRVASMTTLGLRGTAEPAGNTYATVCYTYDESGRVRSQRYLDAKGQPVACNAGYVKVVYQRTGSLVTKEKYYDADDQPMLCASGYAERRR